MARTAKNLWEHIATFSNLAAAFKLVRQGKRFDSDTLAFYASLEENLFALEEQLRQRAWLPKPFRQFWITSPKMRLIQAPAFEDRVVHQAVMLHAAPVLERRFIADTYASIAGRGTHAASKRLRSFMRSASRRWERPYVIKADIKSFFPSLPHALLLHRLERLFADADLLWFFDTLISRSGYDGRGLPVGALTSQWLANLYLDSLDHHAKDDLGIKYYVRYMDDFVVVGESKTWCRETLSRLQAHVEGLQLALNPKTGLFPISQGVDFVGYRHWTSHVRPRKRTLKVARKSFKTMRRLYHEGKIDLEYIRPRVASFAGYMKHCDGHRSTMAILDSFVLKKTRGGQESD